MSKKSQGASAKAQFASYKTGGAYAKNKKAKIERHLRKFPNDEAAKAALKAIRPTPPRKAPENTVWCRNTKELSQMYRMVGESGKMALMEKPDPYATPAKK